MLRYLAVIPARAGSTRLPRKCYLSVGGRTLIQRAVDRVRESQIYQNGQVRLVFCTEDDELADMGRAADLEVIMRPAYLADDYHNLWETNQYVAQALNDDSEISLSVYITPPFLRGWHIDQVAQEFEADPSVKRVLLMRREARFEWNWRLRGKNITRVLLAPGTEVKFPEPNYSCAAFDAIRHLEDVVFDDLDFRQDLKTVGIEIDKIAGLDIDYLEDYRIAEALAMREGL